MVAFFLAMVAPLRFFAFPLRLGYGSKYDCRQKLLITYKYSNLCKLEKHLSTLMTSYNFNLKPNHVIFFLNFYHFIIFWLKRSSSHIVLNLFLFIYQLELNKNFIFILFTNSYLRRHARPRISNCEPSEKKNVKDIDGLSRQL